MLRHLKLVVLSDTHLGTYGCHAKELLEYLKSIKPEILVLNGDIIDGWQFSKKYFPVEHNQIIYELMRMANNGTVIYYLAGNHDEFLRKFTPFKTGNIVLADQLSLKVDDQRCLFFHGDAFDLSVQCSPRLAKLGGFGYDTLIRINTWINSWRMFLGLPKVSIAHAVKRKFKSAMQYVSNFEMMAIQHGIQHKADVVICGHIHIPKIHKMKMLEQKILYLNSGDWIEHLSALEYNDGSWKLYFHNKSYVKLQPEVMEEESYSGNFA